MKEPRFVDLTGGKLGQVFARMGLFAVVGASAGACVTAPSEKEPEYRPSEVLERIAELDETPQWATGTDTFLRNQGQVTYVATLRMSGNSRPEACTQSAANLARMSILREVRDNITLSGQYSEQLASSDPAVESMMAFLSQGQLSGVRVSRNYWEKRVESDQYGSRVLRLFCAAAVEISEQDLRRQLDAAIDDSRGSDPAIRNKLREAHESFISSLAE